MKFTGGYSWQQENSSSYFLEAGDFPNDNLAEIRSFFGAEHSFKINEDQNIADCRIIIGFSLNGVVFLQVFHFDNQTI